MTTKMRTGVMCAALAALLVPARPAHAQLDPLLFAKKTQPNVLIAVDTANRMRRDLNNDYLDANVYLKQGGLSAMWEGAIGVADATTTLRYRRKYVGLLHKDPASSGGDKFEADHIETVGDRDPGYSTFDEATRLWLARRAVIEAVARNGSVARFGLLRTRQDNPRFITPATTGAETYAFNEGPVVTTNSAPQWALQQAVSESSSGKWKITRPVVDRPNGDVTNSGLLVSADAANANTTLVTAINGLTPAGRDAKNVVDAPVDNMLDDIKAEAVRLIGADTDCRNTIAVLIVGGGEGTTTNEDAATKAKAFLNVSNGHRVPIYVIALAPADADRGQLQAIAANSGGLYTEVTAADLTNHTPGKPLPKIVKALNAAVAHAFAAQADFDKAPDASNPIGYSTEHQVTSPIIGTVNLENALDIAGNALPNTAVSNPTTKVALPQRSNVMVTSGFSLPGFDGKLRAFRVYRPEPDNTKPSGWVFRSDGTRLWVAGVPAAASRNIYTALPDGTVMAFTSANAAALQPYLKSTSVAAASTLIDFIRAQPLGAVVDSTPAIMDPPSLDPPPDADYPAFADTNKGRRTLVWVGANDGMLHAIDGRLGTEVWAFIPFNLLPKLNELRSGQPMGDFRFFVDGSAKVADVKIDGRWRTQLVMGEGPGGTFYQTFDVTLDNMAATVTANSDNIADVLTYFADPASVPLKWSFPRYSSFDVNLGTWGDVALSASNVEKTVGETWSDPAVGQIESASGRFVVLTGSGFFKYSVQQNANRNGVVAGTTFYVLDAKTGAVLDSRDVGNDNKAETVDSCAAAGDCSKLKNALQADPVATGPADSRFITKAYLGDLDGKLWRFDIGLDGAGAPKIKQLVSLYTISTGSGVASNHPVFSSMATVNVGGTQQYLFVGTGSDLLPSVGVNVAYALLVVLDNGTSGTRTAKIDLETTDRIGGDEKVTSFPAVAGDIVFFSTTTYRQGGCALPDANLYAFTFIGGAAYDTTGDGRITTTGTSADSTKVRTTTGARASAPFIVDQHLVFATGNKVELFGDPLDFNNGVGQVGVRILSWREVR